MILDIDAGNSRVKWRLREGGRIVEKGSFSSRLPSENVFQIIKGQKILHARLASVSSPDLDAFLVKMIMNLWGIQAHKVTTHNDGPIKVAYEDPVLLGVDRWLAMLAAFDAAKSTILVIDCGTALTIDVVDSCGVHLGGYIVPGYDLMRKSLDISTGHVRVASNKVEHGIDLGCSTVEAVNAGVLLNMVFFISGVYEMVFERNYGDVEVFLTGGNTDMLFQYLSFPYVFNPDLVLDGLALACDRDKTK